MRKSWFYWVGLALVFAGYLGCGALMRPLFDAEHPEYWWRCAATGFVLATMIFFVHHIGYDHGVDVGRRQMSDEEIKEWMKV